jgi:hypothetical protein
LLAGPLSAEMTADPAPSSEAHAPTAAATGAARLEQLADEVRLLRGEVAELRALWQSRT